MEILPGIKRKKIVKDIYSFMAKKNSQLHNAEVKCFS